MKRKLKTWNYLTLHKNCRLLELKIFKIIVLFLQQPQHLKHSEFADKKFSDFAHVHGEVLKGTYLKLTQIALIKLINFCEQHRLRCLDQNLEFEALGRWIKASRAQTRLGQCAGAEILIVLKECRSNSAQNNTSDMILYAQKKLLLLFRFWRWSPL